MIYTDGTFIVADTLPELNLWAKAHKIKAHWFIGTRSGFPRYECPVSFKQKLEVRIGMGTVRLVTKDELKKLSANMLKEPDAIESEKVLEKKLNAVVEDFGGWSIKLLCNHIAGLPDRLVLLAGKAVFVEVKTTKKKLRKIQIKQRDRLEGLGFDVVVIDSSEKLKYFQETYLHNQK